MQSLHTGTRLLLVTARGRLLHRRLITISRPNGSVREVACKGDMQIDLSGLPQGVYFVCNAGRAAKIVKR